MKINWKLFNKCILDTHTMKETTRTRVRIQHTAIILEDTKQQHYRAAHGRKIQKVILLSRI